MSATCNLHYHSKVRNTYLFAKLAILLKTRNNSLHYSCMIFTQDSEHSSAHFIANIKSSVYKCDCNLPMAYLM